VGVAFSNGNTQNSVATFSCNLGGTPPPAVTCAASSGTTTPWPQRQNGNCNLPPQCTGAPANPTNGQVHFSSGNDDGSVASFTCNGAGSPPASVTCNYNNNAAWPAAQAGSCTAGCTIPPTAPANGGVTFSNGNLDGSVATFSCTNGGTAALAVTCAVASNNGKWPTPGQSSCNAGPAPTCSSYTCSSQNYMPTANANVNCASGGCTDLTCCNSCPNTQLQAAQTACANGVANGCTSSCQTAADALDAAFKAISGITAAQASKCATDWNEASIATRLAAGQSICGVNAATNGAQQVATNFALGGVVIVSLLLF